MPIPPFDHNLVLPPHLGNPTDPSQISPYHCTTLELCQRFATSYERKDILKKFLAFRNQLRTHRILNALQWIDGSFLEDIEQQEKRPPRDIDVVTIYSGYDHAFQLKVALVFPEFQDPILAKVNYAVDHYPFDASHSPRTTVEFSRYWALLFSHNRRGVWKGMLSIDLNTPALDIDATTLLNTI